MKHLILVFALISICALSKSGQAVDLFTNPHLLGDWGGTRPSLAEQGVTFNVGYGGESAHNFSGGQRQISEYTDQWVFGAGFDFEKLGFWKGGEARVTITHRSGDNLGEDAGMGNNMLIQEVYGRGQTWHTTQFWLNQKFLDNQLELKLGRMTIGEDFASFSCDFQNLTFCGSQPGNIVGNYWVNWPTSQWAARLKYHHSHEHTYSIGAYEMNPHYTDDSYARAHGLTLDDPDGSTGTLVPVEYAYTPKLGEHPGSYKFGAWYNSSKASDIGDPTEEHNSQYGVYINFEQQVLGTEAEPELSVFLNISQADRATAGVDRQISLGTQYQGHLIRHHDSVGFALGNTDNNSRAVGFVGNGNEYVSELYYSYQPIASLFLRPNVQYILQPGGNSDNKNAFVGGLKTGVAF